MIVVLKTISSHRIQIRLRNARGQRPMVKTMLVTWIFSEPNHVSGPERFSRNRYASVVRGHAGPEIYVFIKNYAMTEISLKLSTRNDPRPGSSHGDTI